FMGQIVAAMVSCHALALFLRQPSEDPAQLDATIAAMRQPGRVLDETKPDVLIVVGLDHLEAFSLDVSVAFAVRMKATNDSALSRTWMDVHRVSAADGREGCREDSRSPESRKAGAHPILAWTVVHLVAADVRAQGAEKWIEQTRLCALDVVPKLCAFKKRKM